ncbi:nitroreductase family protein [Pontibacter flavimaris]|uniref:Putative NAD(P)H nitroreductase n=1 Tax=Pontibacter flavimaris TaxID=1797110 RepID=A0A1Q5PDJ7_9BACT|nr:nitroreductase [Pontibacter flavimaris]OKL40296.1 nitroreductase [Pontibacter flavimaris]
MNALFQSIKQVIETRRTTKPPKMNGQRIPDAQITQLLQLADWAPTHGHTEPWRFIVYADDALKTFCQNHADLYRQNTPEEKFLSEKYEKLLHMGDKASHILVAYMRRGELPKIPELEEIAATSCAIQNLLLGASALGMASYWGSGGMAYHPSMKKHLQLREQDVVLGILYLGYAEDAAYQGKRKVPLQEKVTWVK